MHMKNNVIKTLKEIKTRRKDSLQILLFIFMMFGLNGIYMKLFGMFIGKILPTFQVSVQISIVNRIFLGLILFAGYLIVPLGIFCLFKLLILDSLFHGSKHNTIPWKKYLPFYWLNIKILICVGILFLIWNFIGGYMKTWAILIYAVIGILILYCLVYPWVLISHLMFWKEKAKPLIGAFNFVKTHLGSFLVMVVINIMFDLLILFLIGMLGGMIGYSINWKTTLSFNNQYAMILIVIFGITQLIVILFNQFYVLGIVKEKLK